MRPFSSRLVRRYKMDTKDTISVLNDLIETSKDGEKGFLECAEDLSSRMGEE